MTSGRGVRIIGGRWRGRRVPVADATGLRPSADRVRETLFNWLAPRVEGSRCLDLFAGSGVLGLEALSRGASEVIFVERSAAALSRLRDSIRELDATGARVVRDDAWRWLRRGPAAAGCGRFDLVFVDAPFAASAAVDVPVMLASGAWLAPDALVYMELPLDAGAAMPPPGFACRRSARAGHVWYGLLRAGE